ncbi:alanine--tRNA ligase [Patescibacteria group bacterium]|nr:alanine--tRNA ligase [Patescibacteria group bacterium]
MKASEIRKRFLEFYKNRGHKEIASAPLVPENDPTTLFTSSGMQPLVPYLLGQPHPLGKRLVNSQKCFRSQDIDEVGDTSHTTFFEMLGNWSLGDYFKKEQLSWFFEFITNELGLDPKRLYISIFKGNGSVPKDEESIEIWKTLFSSVNVSAEIGKPASPSASLGGRIFLYPARNNWWSRSGEPENMPVGEPGGPDSEVFYDFGIELGLHKKSPYKNQACHPNCQCGRFMEIGNSVFMQYQKLADGSLKELKPKSVDFGGGLERLTAATLNKPDIFKIDLFNNAIKTLEAIRKSGGDYKTNPKPYRIIVDHLRAAIFMVADGVEPSNKERGYMLRRLIRRAMVYSRKLGMTGDEWLSNVSPDLITPYIHVYPHLEEKSPEIHEIITREVDKFRKTIGEGINALKKIFNRAIGGIDRENLPQGMIIENNIIRVSGVEVFKIYETYGLTPEIAQEVMTDWGLRFDEETMKECREEMKKHQELSRTAAAGMFKGGLADANIKTTKLHTATHLLHQALRMVLGDHVSQKGSNITVERLRFDFSHPKKVTDEELKKAEAIVNEKIKENLPVTYEEMDKDDALKSGALGFFVEKYGDRVKVYSILDFSREICAGPLVNFTGELGHFTIIKEESAASGIRRIYARLRPD